MTLYFPRRRVSPALATLAGLCFLGLPILDRLNVLADEDVSTCFYASFDKNVLGDEAVGDESPLANQNLKIGGEGKGGGAALLEFGSVLIYDAPGNVKGERGPVGFW